MVQEVLSARLKFCRCGVLYISLLNIYKAGREERKEEEGREEEFWKFARWKERFLQVFVEERKCKVV